MHTTTIQVSQFSQNIQMPINIKQNSNIQK